MGLDATISGGILIFDKQGGLSLAAPKGNFCRCSARDGWRYADLQGALDETNTLMLCVTCGLTSRYATEWCLDCGDEYVLAIEPDPNLLCPDCEPLYA